MNIKVQVTKSDNLCCSCLWGHVREHQDNSTYIFCNEIQEPIGQSVTKCNDYKERHNSPLSQMEKIAWEVKADRYGKITGFQPPKKSED